MAIIKQIGVKPENDIVFALNSSYIATRSISKYASSTVKPSPQIRVTEPIPPDYIFMTRTDGKSYGSTDVAVSARYTSFPGIPKVPSLRRCNPATWIQCDHDNVCEFCDDDGYIKKRAYPGPGNNFFMPSNAKCVECIEQPCDPVRGVVVEWVDKAKYIYGPCYYCDDEGDIRRKDTDCELCIYDGPILGRIPRSTEEKELWDLQYSLVQDVARCNPGERCDYQEEIETFDAYGFPVEFIRINPICLALNQCWGIIPEVVEETRFKKITRYKFLPGCWTKDENEEWIALDDCHCWEPEPGRKECRSFCPPVLTTSTAPTTTPTTTPTVTATVTATPTSTTPTSTPT